ncbi:MAG: GNAT family N-acetyltransferase [Lentisphaeria bacterium]|nr:GNAT family N-acetyltransferase [Lentisphaeria bacterium]
MQIEFEELLTVDALETLRSVAFKVWPQTFASILSQDQIDYMMEMMYAPQVLAKELAEGMHFEILRINNEPSGYIAYSAYPKEPGKAKLHKVYLLPVFHSLGIGQQMLDHAREQCKKLGFDAILLTVNKHNERAIKAYKRNGFITTAAVKVPIGQGFFMDDYIMEKAL